MSSSIRASIHLDKTGPYTNLEYITGKVHVKVLKDVSVENIQIKLEGISETQLLRRYVDRNGKRKTETRSETHELMYDVNTLFPPNNVKSVSKSNEFTLVPGDYVYDFKFQFPLWAQCANTHRFEGSNLHMSPEERTRYNSHKSRNKNANSIDHIIAPLPPSFSANLLTEPTNRANVSYFLKLTVRRASKLAMNTRQVLPLQLALFDPEDKIPGIPTSNPQWIFTKELSLVKRLGPNLTEINQRNKPKFFRMLMSSEPEYKYHETFAHVYGAVTTPLVVPGGHIGVHLMLTTKSQAFEFRHEKGQSNELGIIYIESLSFEITSTVRMRAQGYSTGEQVQRINLLQLERVGILDLADAVPSGLKTQDRVPLYKVDFPSEVLDHLTVPVNIPQSFQTCNLSNSYMLTVKITLSSYAGEVDYRVPIVLNLPIEVLSGVPPPRAVRDPVAPQLPPKDESYLKDQVGTSSQLQENDVPSYTKEDEHLSEQQQQQANETNGSPDEQLPSYNESVVRPS